MFRLAARTLNNTAKGVLRSNIQNGQVVSANRLMSSHATEETDDEFDARYEAYFSRPDIDGWELRKAINDLATMDVVPSPRIVASAMKACRKLNDFALTIRILETVKFKTGGRDELYHYVVNEVKPVLEELGIPTLEEIGYDKPELALVNVFDIH